MVLVGLLRRIVVVVRWRLLFWRLLVVFIFLRIRALFRTLDRVYRLLRPEHLVVHREVYGIYLLTGGYQGRKIGYVKEIKLLLIIDPQILQQNLDLFMFG